MAYDYNIAHRCGDSRYLRKGHPRGSLIAVSRRSKESKLLHENHDQWTIPPHVAFHRSNSPLSDDKPARLARSALASLVIRVTLAGPLLGDGGLFLGLLHGDAKPVHGSTLVPQPLLAL
jgi:hypothetical protein